MMNTKKRWLAALLSVVMVVAMLPSMAFAAVGDGLAPKNVKVEDKTGVVTWDQVIAKDGAYKAESGDYVVQLQSKLKASVNAQDWTEVTSGIKTAAAANLDTSIKTMSAVIDYSKLADLDAAKYEFRISVAYDGEATTAAVTKQATDATKAQAVTRDTVKLEQDGKTGELVANFTAASANVVPTGYKVNLYKNKDLLVKEPTAVPSTATLVKTVEAKAVTAGMEARFPASDFTFTKDGQNTYFVTVVSTRSEYADSAAVFQASNAAAPNKEKTGLVATELAAATAAPTVVFVDKETASAKTDMNVKVTTAAAKQTVYVEIFKNVAGTPKVAEYSEYIATSGQSKTFDFSDKITEKGSYFAKAYAKAVGAKDSSIVTTKSKDFTPVGTLVAPVVSISDEGKILIEAGKNQPTGASAIVYKGVLLYKGNVASSQETVANDNVAKTVFANKLFNGVPAIIDTKTDKGYNLGDFSIKVIATMDGFKPSEAVIGSVIGTLAAPKNVIWENVATSVNPIAKWDAVEGAETYDVKIYHTSTRDEGNLVGEAKDVKTTKINASEYLTASVADKDLAFTVTAKAKGKISATATSILPLFDVKADSLAKVANVKWDGNKAVWDANTNAKSYTVKKFVNGKQVGPDCSTTTNSYQFKGLSKPGVYEFTVTANGEGAGNLSSVPVKSDVKFIESKILGTPIITNAYKTKTTVKLRWTEAANAEVYRIYVKAPGQSKYKIIVKEVRGDATAKTVKGLKKGTRYQFKVKAVNSGVGAFSNVKVATTTK